MTAPRLPWDDAPEVSPPRVDAPPTTRAPLRIACAPSAATRLALVHAALAASPVDDWLVLAPSHAHADAIVRDACASLDSTAGRYRLGLSELALRLATPRLAADNATPATALGFEALVSRTLSRLRTSGQLGRLAAAADHPGFLGALASTLQELRLADVSPRDLDVVGGIGHDLASCAKALDESFADLRQVDRALLLRHARAALEVGDTALPGRPHLPLVVIDPPCVSRLEVEFLATLITRAPSAIVIGPAGDVGFEALAHLLACQIEQLDTGAKPSVSPPRLARVQRFLFVSNEPSTDTDADAEADDASVDLLSAPGEGRECVEVVRRLTDAATTGMRWDDMAVVVRAPHLYASHLETALRRADVPTWFSRGTRRPDPSGRALLALISCALEGLAARRFAEYLSLGQVPMEVPVPVPVPVPALADAEAEPATALPAAATPPSPQAPRRSPWRWEALLNEACVIGGRDRWQRRLEGFREELLTRAAVVATDEPESPRVEALQRRAALIDELLTFSLPVIDQLDTWIGDVTTWRIWIDRMTTLARSVLARPEHVLEVLAELEPMADVADVALADVFDVLRERLTQVSVPPPETPYGRVFVGSPDDLRGRTFRLVCILGLSERVFPQRSRQDPLLLDEMRAQLSPWLVTDARRLADERLRLRLSVGAASDCLLTSFSSFDAAQSRPRVPSFYALDIQRACGGRLPGYEHLLRAAQQASGARLAWPAPADATRAIDWLEHDLSVLQRHLRGTDEDVRGRARYLFEGHPGLRRSLVMRHDRTRRRWTPSDGLVSDASSSASITASLARHRLDARAYSVSALQRFAVCPYQFYLSTVVRLAPRDEAEAVTSMDPLTRGSIVHEVLATVMRSFQTHGWLPLTEARLADAQTLADQIVNEIVAARRDRLVPPIERIWLDEVDTIRRDVREWVRRLPEDHRGWTPALVEFGFGFGRGDGRDNASVRTDVVLDHGWRLHGVIDLAEQGPDDTWRITDYKTGRNRLADVVLINRGETLQPALYAMALEQARGGRVVASRLWFCTSDGAYAQRDVPVDVTRNAQARERAIDVLAIVDRSVAAGFLPAAPKQDACSWCNFLAVCGPDAQTRTRGKPREPLGDLLHVRSQR